MDGYAVRAADTAGAGPTRPARLELRGAVAMGTAPTQTVGPGVAVAITTGGMLPDGADAVVMLEHVREADGLEVFHAAHPGEHVVRPGEDLRQGELLIPAGRRLRAQDLGLLASFGLTTPELRRQPRVGLISTGSELVPPDARPGRGQIRDVNQTVLAAQVRRAGAIPVAAGIVVDDAEALRATILDLLGRCDAVLLSGGSSVGSHDLAARVVASLGPPGVLFHGLRVKPGKPTLCARIGDQPVIGMPGHPVSSLVIFDVFIRPLLGRLAGDVRCDPWPTRRAARLARSVSSPVGREEYLRVRLQPATGGSESLALPLPGGSAEFGTVIRADGLVVVPEEAPGLDEGAPVEVLLFD
jgi:molybdopterin molybdotransferase